ncbi:TPA: hypothetical protein ACH6AG_001197 [Campylobacter jejuni]
MKSSVHYETGMEEMSKFELIIRLIFIVFGIFLLVVEPIVFQEYIGNSASDLVLIYRTWSLSILATGCVSFYIGTTGIRLVMTLFLHLLVITAVPLAFCVMVIASLPELRLVPGYGSMSGVSSMIVIVCLIVRVLIDRLIDQKLARLSEQGQCQD